MRVPSLSKRAQWPLSARARTYSTAAASKTKTPSRWVRLGKKFNQTGRPKRDEKGPFVPFCAPFVPFGEERPVLATFLSRFVRKPLAGCPVYRANGMAQMWHWRRGAGASRFCPVCARRRAWIGPVWPCASPLLPVFSWDYRRGFFFFFFFVRGRKRGRLLSSFGEVAEDALAADLPRLDSVH